MAGFGPVASVPVASVGLGTPIRPPALYPETPPIRTDAYRFKWRPLTDDAPANIALTAPVFFPPIRPGTNFVPHYQRWSKGDVWPSNPAFIQRPHFAYLLFASL